MYQPPQTAGIRFRTITAPESPSLPRMDIAGLVGFAAQGPVNMPVAVEDVRQYRDIFGPDPDLAWDEEEGRFEKAHLGAAVEAFFAEGGRRAYIVRVAGSGAASAGFEIPGLLGDADMMPARLTARAPGTWAGALQAEASFERRRVRLRPGSGFDLATALQFLPGADGLAPGDLLELRLPGETLSAYVPVTARAEGGGLNLGSPYWIEPDPYGGSDLLAVAEASAEARFDAWSTATPGFAPALYLLRMTISARLGEEPVLRLRDMALGAAHPRWFGHLLPDERALAPRNERFGAQADPAAEAFLAETLTPRFPFAGAEASGPNAFWLPQTRDGVLTIEQISAGASGLDAFDAADFLDEDLRRAGAGALRAEADGKILVRGEAATGLHALWPIEEIALLAVPDAVHRPWLRAAPPPQDLPDAPVLNPPTPLADAQVELDWTVVADAEAYRVQMAADPDFEQVLAEENTPSLQLRLALPTKCPHKLFFRVRGQVGGGITPWSNSQGAWLPLELAGPCGRPQILHLTLSALPAGSPDEAYVLFWGGLEEVEIEASADPAFLAAETRFTGSAAQWVEDQPFGVGLYMRARFLGPGGPHPWSNTVFIPPLPRSDFTLVTKREYDGIDLLSLHSAALRFCAARADVTVTLSVAQFADPLVHLATLRPTADSPATTTANVPPLSSGEIGIFSYGALSHPWQLRLDGDVVRPQPPDGTAIGQAAATARGAGAWIAAANQPITDILGLTDLLDTQTRGILEGAGVNPVIKDARGYLTMSDWTLSADSALCHMNIRRLLILLRRLALREGRTMVFEPNGAPLRELVQSRFDQLMERLYLRGAFHGARPDEAFQVITDASVNPPASIEAGRFVVELRVAPARPLAFLRVQLFQTGGDGFTTREVSV